MDSSNGGWHGGKSSGGRSFSESAQRSPCEECSAPCCSFLLIPHPVPGNFMDLDYIRYMLGFPDLSLLINSAGEWQVMLERECTLLDSRTRRCTVHNTPRKPKTCVFFNPYRCWYKRNFAHGRRPVDAVRLDTGAFERLLERVKFDEEQNVVDVPGFDELKELGELRAVGPARDASDGAPVVGSAAATASPPPLMEPWQRSYLVPLSGTNGNEGSAEGAASDEGVGR